MSTDREILDILGTDERLNQALANVGVDLACGACAIAFFTGVGFPGDPGHTCGRVMYCATCRCTCGRIPSTPSIEVNADEA
jgi:hypothetical protein